MSTSKYIEKFRSVLDVYESLRCKIYNLKSKSSSLLLSSLFVRPEWGKIRTKIEQSFPDVSELRKVQGFDSFRTDAKVIVQELGCYGDVILEVIEFKNLSSSIILGLPFEILDLKLDKHRVVVILYLSVLVAYMKIIIMLSSINEIKPFIKYYWVALLLSESPTCTRDHDVAVLIESLSSPLRSFVDSFQSLASYLGGLLPQLKEPFQVLSDCENLRGHYALNPSHDGLPIATPAKKQVSQFSPLSLYTELASVGKYEEFVVFGYIACPSLLYSPEHWEVFKAVVKNCLVLPLHRDMLFSVHRELDGLVKVFPSDAEKAKLKALPTTPKDFKLKRAVPPLTELAIANAQMEQMEVRSFLLAELRNMNSFLNIVPGALAPKFPQALALASLAKWDIERFFRQQMVEAFRNATSRATLTEITAYVAALYELVDKVETRRLDVRRYYREFLSGADAKALAALAEASSESLSTFGGNISQLLGKIRQDCSSLPTSASSDSAVAGSRASLEGLRLNCERLTLALLSKALVAVPRDDNITKLLQRLQIIYERSFLADDTGLVAVLKNSFTPYNSYFPLILSEAFRISLDKSHDPNLSPLVTLRMLASATLSSHPDVPDELESFGEGVAKECDSMMVQLIMFVENQFLEYWKQSLELERQIQPVEAANRIEKHHRSRRNPQMDQTISPNMDLGLSATPDHARLPGMESQPWESPAIDSLVLSRQRLLNTFAAARKLGVIRVYSREISVFNAMRNRITAVFENKLQMIVGGSALERHTFSFRRIVTAFRAMQTTLCIIDSDMADVIRRILESNFNDPALPVIGQEIPLDIKPTEPEKLIWKMAGYLLGFIERVGKKDSKFVWVAGLSTFARYGTNGSITEQILNREELVALCTFVGVNGVRVVDFRLLTFILRKVQEIKGFLVTNRKHFILLRENPLDKALSSLFAVGGMGPFFLSMIQMGLAMAFRQMLHTAFEEVQSVYCPLIKETLTASITAVDQSPAHKEWQSPTDPSAGGGVGDGTATVTDDGTQLEEELRYTRAFTGVTGSLHPLDTTLHSSLSRLLLEDSETYSFISEAVVACVMRSDLWTSCSYVPELDVFSGNEHVMLYALSKLIIASYPNTAKVRSECMGFISMASKVLIDSRSQEAAAGSAGSSKKESPPLRAMTLIPYLFHSYCPFLKRSDLEQHLPFEVLMAAESDVFMGRQRAGDVLRLKFTLPQK